MRCRFRLNSARRCLPALKNASLCCSCGRIALRERVRNPSGREGAAQNGSRSSSPTRCLGATEDTKGSGACRLSLLYSHCREGLQFRLLSELEQPSLFLFSACPCVPDPTQTALTTLSYTANLQARALLPHTAGSKGGLCAVAQWMVPLAVSAVLGT